MNWQKFKDAFNMVKFVIVFIFVYVIFKNIKKLFDNTKILNKVKEKIKTIKIKNNNLKADIDKSEQSYDKAIKNKAKRDAEGNKLFKK